MKTILIRMSLIIFSFSVSSRLSADNALSSNIASKNIVAIDNTVRHPKSKFKDDILYLVRNVYETKKYIMKIIYLELFVCKKTMNVSEGICINGKAVWTNYRLHQPEGPTSGGANYLSSTYDIFIDASDNIYISETYTQGSFPYILKIETYKVKTLPESLIHIRFDQNGRILENDRLLDNKSFKELFVDQADQFKTSRLKIKYDFSVAIRPTSVCFKPMLSSWRAANDISFLLYFPNEENCKNIELTLEPITKKWTARELSPNATKDIQIIELNSAPSEPDNAPGKK